MPSFPRRLARLAAVPLSELRRERRGRSLRTWVCVLLTASAASQIPAAPTAQAPYGLARRTAPPAYLQMPPTATGRIPARLSQTGVFKDLKTLTPSPGLIPYDLVVPFWSDGARKLRWVAVPAGKKIQYSPTGEWRFPAGTVFVKTFELSTDESNPKVVRRLETRLLVRDDAGGVYGVVYKWRADQSDADLLSTSLTEPVSIRSGDGSRSQSWYYPSREDCMKCHTSAAGGVLGVKTRQMNRPYAYPDGVTDNQLRAWSHLGLFEPAPDEATLASLATLAAPDDTSRSLEDRARSYLDANCSQCHRPGGVVANFDARYDTPLASQQLLNGPLLFDQGIDRAHVITPHDVWRSLAYLRINTVGDIRMPPVARQTIDSRGVALLKEWIDAMPGRDVLEPPTISAVGGTQGQPLTVTLKAAPGAQIHYTLDGSSPGTSDPVYEGPISITGPTVLRARAYKEGFTRSTAAQQVFSLSQ